MNELEKYGIDLPKEIKKSKRLRVINNTVGWVGGYCLIDYLFFGHNTPELFIGVIAILLYLFRFVRIFDTVITIKNDR